MGAHHVNYSRITHPPRVLPSACPLWQGIPHPHLPTAPVLTSHLGFLYSQYLARTEKYKCAKHYTTAGRWKMIHLPEIRPRVPFNNQLKGRNLKQRNIKAPLGWAQTTALSRENASGVASSWASYWKISNKHKIDMKCLWQEGTEPVLGHWGPIQLEILSQRRETSERLWTEKMFS